MITPLRDMVLVELRDDAPPHRGVIAVIRTERQPSTRARVVAIGDEVRDLAAGVNVVISRLQGIEIANGMLLIPESAVLATEPHDA